MQNRVTGLEDPGQGVDIVQINFLRICALLNDELAIGG